MTPIAAIEYERVTVRYAADGPPAVEGLTFSLAPGERAAMIGLNGSGKTTALLAAAGLVAAEGTIRVGGIELSKRTLPEIRARMGFVFSVPENQLLFPRVDEDVAFALVRQGLPRAEVAARVREVLASLGIAELERASVHELSHGQKQRVALAGALAARPPLLLLDEPSAGLDPPGQRALARILSTLDAAVLVATHDLDFAARCCTRYLLLQRGRLRRAGKWPERRSRSQRS